MVIKYIKHELNSLVRVAIIPAVFMICFAVILKISFYTIAGDDSSGFMTLFALLYVYAMLATLCVCFYFGALRFYKSFFTGEGYMTLSLPMSATQIICAKLISALIVMFGGIVVCLLSVLIVLIGESTVLSAIWQAVGSLSSTIEAYLSSSPLAIVEIILLVLVSIPAGLLECYFIISVAQMFTTKNRKAILAIIFVGALTLNSVLDQTLFLHVRSLAAISIHLYLWVQILIRLALDAAFFFLTRYIVTHKANLLV